MKKEYRILYCEEKVKVFNDYVNEHKLNFKNLSNYVCPMCKNGFPFDSDVLSGDHVPQEALGGKHEIVVCKECNSTKGHSIDINLINYIKFSDYNLKRKGCEIDLSIGTDFGGGQVKLFYDENNEIDYSYLEKHNGVDRMEFGFQQSYLHELHKLGKPMPEIDKNSNKHWLSYNECLEFTNKPPQNIFNINAVPKRGTPDNKLALIGLLKNVYLQLFDIYSYPILFEPYMLKISEIINNTENNFDDTFLNILTSYDDVNTSINYIIEPDKLNDIVLVKIPYTIKYSNTNLTTNYGIFLSNNLKFDINENFSLETIKMISYKPARRF